MYCQPPDEPGGWRRLGTDDGAVTVQRFATALHDARTLRAAVTWTDPDAGQTAFTVHVVPSTGEVSVRRVIPQEPGDQWVLGSDGHQARGYSELSSTEALATRALLSTLAMALPMASITHASSPNGGAARFRPTGRSPPIPGRWVRSQTSKTANGGRTLWWGLWRLAREERLSPPPTGTHYRAVTRNSCSSMTASSSRSVTQTRTSVEEFEGRST